MKELTSLETPHVAGASVAGVLVYGTIGFWVGGITGFCMGVFPAIPGSILGMTIGAYLGTDSQPQVIYIVDNSPKV